MTVENQMKRVEVFHPERPNQSFKTTRRAFNRVWEAKGFQVKEQGLTASAPGIITEPVAPENAPGPAPDPAPTAPTKNNKE